MAVKFWNANEVNPTLTELGQSGDVFGGVNALFAALAFAGVAVAAYFQWRASQQAHLQAFENTFFSSLNLLNAIVAGLRFDPQSIPAAPEMVNFFANAGRPLPRLPEVTGREVFPAIANRIAAHADLSKTNELYTDLQNKQNYVLGHYFRHLYQILKMIDGQPKEILNRRSKKRYSSILRAQLSTGELALLLLNCKGKMVDDGQFRNYLVRYQMLEHLSLILQDGVYLTRESRLRLLSGAELAQFEDEIDIYASMDEPKGAFGSNPMKGNS